MQAEEHDKASGLPSKCKQHRQFDAVVFTNSLIVSMTNFFMFERRSYDPWACPAATGSRRCDWTALGGSWARCKKPFAQLKTFWMCDQFLKKWRKLMMTKNSACRCRRTDFKLFDSSIFCRIEKRSNLQLHQLRTMSGHGAGCFSVSSSPKLWQMAMGQFQFSP